MNSRGFTLIELILVMAMLVVIMAMAAPTLANFFRGRNLESEARRMLSLTRYGQNRAASEGIPMIFWIDPATGQYGLRAHESYLFDDTNALEFQLATNLQASVELIPIPTNANPWNLSTPQLDSANSQRLPEIYFEPDGTIGESSIPHVRLQRHEQESLWIIQSLNRLHYEIRENTNTWIQLQR